MNAEMACMPVDAELSLDILENIEATRRNYVDRLRRLTAVSAEDALKKLSVELMAMYQIDGLDAIRALAKMDICDNFQQNQVKLAAAKLLAFPGGAPTQAKDEGSLAGVLSELNDQYHKSAPRIRQIRERVVTYDEPAALDVTPG